MAIMGCCLLVEGSKGLGIVRTAMMPNTRFDVAVKALPVPRSLVKKISGVYE